MKKTRDQPSTMKLTGAQYCALTRVAHDDSIGRKSGSRPGIRSTMRRLQQLGLVTDDPVWCRWHLTERGKAYLLNSPDRPRSCKVGTQPALVLLKDAAPPVVGTRVEFRYFPDTWGEWQTGFIDRVNDDGYFFMSLL